MRTVWIAVLGLLGVCPAVRAGVYHLHRTDPPRPAHLIPAYIFQLRAAALEPKGKLDPDSMRAVYLAEVDHFEPMLQNGNLSTIEAISLSSAYIRLGKVNQAIRLLHKIDPDKEHFLVQANLAGAYQTAGELELAHRHQQVALYLWPRAWAGWSSATLELLRETEQYNLRLLASRLDEARRGNLGAPVGLDPLFPGVRFVGDSGKYAPGELSRPMRDALPRHAGEIVLQLVMWQPNDRRLCWMLAELLNVYGNVGAAYQIIDSLVSIDGVAFAGLRQHHKVLRGGKLAMDQLEKRENRYGLMSELMMLPRPALGAPGVGDVAYCYSALAAPVAIAPFQDKPPSAPEPDGVLTPPPPLLPFNLTHVGVSFVFGILVAALLGMQWRQWKQWKNRPERLVVDARRSPTATAKEPASES